MKFLYTLLFCLIAKQALARGLPDFFEINETENIDNRPNRFFSFVGRLGDFGFAADDEEDTRVPVLPSFPSALLFLDPSRFSTLAALPGNSIGRNANPNGEGRVLGAILALRALSNHGSGGIIINTPLNLTNVNTNIPAAAPATPTVTTVAQVPTGTAAAAGTRIIPYPVPSPGYFDRRSQNDASNGSQTQVKPVKVIRRRPVRRQYKKPGFSRVQYLRV